MPDPSLSQANNYASQGIMRKSSPTVRAVTHPKRAESRDQCCAAPTSPQPKQSRASRMNARNTPHQIPLMKPTPSPMHRSFMPKSTTPPPIHPSSCKNVSPDTRNHRWLAVRHAAYSTPNRRLNSQRTFSTTPDGTVASPSTESADTFIEWRVGGRRSRALVVCVAAVHIREAVAQ